MGDEEEERDERKKRERAVRRREVVWGRKEVGWLGLFPLESLFFFFFFFVVLQPTTMQCVMLGGAERIGNVGSDNQENMDDVGHQWPKT